ncbi:MAG: hypothetical protein ACFNX0_08105, partial [Treponema sp.]
MKEINILPPPPPNSVGNPAPFRSGGTFLFSFQLNYSAHYTHKPSPFCVPFHCTAGGRIVTSYNYVYRRRQLLSKAFLHGKG